MNPLTRLRIWQCERDEGVAITPLNVVAEWEQPGATGRQTRLFHWLLKRPLRRIARSVRVPRPWVENLPGNWRIVHDILKETYLDHEGQARRAGILWPLIEYGLCVLAYDNNYDEVGEAGLWAIVRNADRFTFDPHKANPHNWYADDRACRVEVTQAPEGFRVLAVTGRELWTDRPLSGRCVTVPGEGGSPVYLALDLGHAVEHAPGVTATPITGRGASPLDLFGAFSGVPA